MMMARRIFRKEIISYVYLKKTKKVDQMRPMFKLNALLISVLALSARSTAQVANIDAGNVKQYVDGFGASTAWHGQLSEKEADAGFKNDNDNQLGLSILRIRIDENRNYFDELKNAQKAMARGAIVFASPWNAPSNMLETVSGLQRVRYDKYEDYAVYLNSFVTYMANNGAPLYAISVQNEPDYGDWTRWTAQEMFTFVRDYAHSITGTEIMAPESFQFRRSMSDPILNDSTACANLDIVGGHIYGAGLARYPLAEEKGKKIWMTEHYINEDDITTCVGRFAKEIIDCMYDNMNAFIWWYLRQPDCNLINPGGSFKKKGYVMAHFSKFIRPGYYRIDATYQPQSGVYLVAFKGEETVIVVINVSTSSKDQTFTFSNDPISFVKRYSTSETKNLSYDGIVDLTNNSFTSTLEGRSVTTFVTTNTSTGAKPLDSPIPQSFSLEQNYPNPFNSSTVISFSLPSKSSVILRVFDMMGREVATLVNEELAAGNHYLQWDASDVSSGVYFYRLRTNTGYMQTKKLLLLK
jgi:glucuronoarabinoxylan endo-1,4-beta-xylanase